MKCLKIFRFRCVSEIYVPIKLKCTGKTSWASTFAGRCDLIIIKEKSAAYGMKISVHAKDRPAKKYKIMRKYHENFTYFIVYAKAFSN